MTTSTKLQDKIDSLDREIIGLNRDLKAAFRAADVDVADALLDRLERRKAIREGLATELEAVKVREAAAEKERQRRELEARRDAAKERYDELTAKLEGVVIPLVETMNTTGDLIDEIATARAQADAEHVALNRQLGTPVDALCLNQGMGLLVDNPPEHFDVIAFALWLVRNTRRGWGNDYQDALRGLGLVSQEKANLHWMRLTEPRASNPPEQRLDPVDLAQRAGVGVPPDASRTGSTPPTPEALDLARSVGIDLTPR